MLDRLFQILHRRLDRLSSRSAPQPATPADPESTARLRTEGNVFLAEEKLDEAEACFREALVHTEDDTQSLVCLGYVLKEQGRWTEARIALKRATSPTNSDPQAFEAHYLLGEISEKQNDFEDAKKHFRSTLDLKPDFVRACEDVVRILHVQGRKDEARAFLEDRVAASPNSTDYQMMLAKEYTDIWDLEGTVRHLSAAIAMGVNDPHIEMILGAALCQLEREPEARPHFDAALSKDMSFLHEALYHRGYHYLRSGDTRVAIDLLEKSIESKPDYRVAHSLILLGLSHAATALNRSYQQAAERFSQACESPITPMPLSAAESEIERKVLRIGFVAGEFREHPVQHFLVGILEHFDRDRFQLVAFSNNQADDSGTKIFKALFADWHDIKRMNDDEVADLIRTQKIDVLIDLSGHTGDGRLLAFARKPAPVQVAWLGYFASTGLKAMDYIIADKACVPDDSEEWFSEKVFHLPSTRLCMAVPQPSRPIPIAPAPCKSKGYVTFGSFQQTSKINAQVLAVWAKAMAAVPKSRLRIQNKGLHTTSIQNRIRADMELAGIDLSRVDLLGSTGWEDYLEAHNEVDILFDTFPYPGGTTTAFALWMGVPTVTLAGNTMLSLQGASMLGCVGLNDWVAKDEAEYVAITTRFANDTERLVQIRCNLRDVAERSPLFDTKTFAHNLENALRAMYLEKITALAALPAHSAILAT